MKRKDLTLVGISRDSPVLDPQPQQPTGYVTISTHEIMIATHLSLDEKSVWQPVYVTAIKNKICHHITEIDGVCEYVKK